MTKRKSPDDVLEYREILGISHAKDLTRIPKNHLFRAINCDVDVEMMLHRRRGTTKLYDGSYHSGWSNNEVCYVVKNGDLVEFKKDNTFSTILANVGYNDMSFIDVNGVVYFTNNEIVGYINSSGAHAFPDPDQQFKERMVGGSILEYYNSRLFAVQEDTIFYSDAARPMVMDKRHNFIQMHGRVTMLQAVVDGLYVSHGEHVSFIKERTKSPVEHGGSNPPSWIFTPIIDVPAFPGMYCKIEGEKISPKVEAVVVIWLGGEGAFMGKPGGEFERLTGRNLFIDGVSKGKAALIIRDLHGGFLPGYPSIIFSYDVAPGFGGSKFNIEMPLFKTNIS